MNAVTRLLRAILCGCVIVAASAAAAAGTAPIPIEDFVRLDQMGDLRFSPDGKRFAGMAERDGVMRLMVVDADTLKGRSYASPRGNDIRSFRWLTNDVIVADGTRRGMRADRLSGADFVPMLITLDDKSKLRHDHATRALRRVPGSQTGLIVDVSAPDEPSQRLVVVDAVSGEVVKPVTGERPGPHILRWVLDDQLVPRAALGWNKGANRYESWWRDAQDAPWRMIGAYDPDRERGFTPVALDAQGRLLVLSTLATGRRALYRFNFATGQPGELLVGHMHADIGVDNLRYDADGMAPVGVTIDGDRPQTYWFDERMQSVQRIVDASLPPDRSNDLQFLRNGKVLVHATGPRDPGTYYLYDPQARTITEWSRVRPWLRPEVLGSTEVLRYKARDGLEIPAYLTVPPGRTDAPPPLVVWVHGGPHARDRWEFDPVVQFLATRGYAVLQANFRGSTGYGSRFVAAADREWGRAMQDDLTDGVRWLIAQGRIDARRVCIGGASYGGYAALMALVREPALFRCAIDLYGPTDLSWIVDLPEADYNRGVDERRDRNLKMTVGDPDVPAERAVMDAHSPRLQAARIKSPVLLVYGTNDRRVPLRHGTAMRDALQAAGASYEWKSFTGEAHGLLDVGNNAAVLRMMEAFLVRHLGADAPATAGSAAR